MRVASVKTGTKTLNMEETPLQAFSIKADAAMFNFLSSSLYTNKIRAVIREVTCNAWDAHQSAKRYDTPIDIHLPNSLEPFFSVTDYGTGLPSAKVMELFSTFGASTKQGGNKEIGGFGVGSKSPFSYVDSFSVENRYKGSKYFYTAFKDENGMATIAHLDTVDMEPEELTGITVRLDVKESDFQRFADEATTVLMFFDKPTVNVTGSSIKSKNDVMSIIHENEFGILVKGMYGGSPSVLMGNVVYPIPSEVYDSMFGASTYRKGNYPLAGSITVYLKSPIGGVEPAPSREHLSVTKKTSPFLKELFDKFLAEFAASSQKHIEQIREMYAYEYAVEKFHDNFLEPRTLHSIKFQGKFKITYDGTFNDPSSKLAVLSSRGQTPFKRKSHAWVKMLPRPERYSTVSSKARTLWTVQCEKFVEAANKKFNFNVPIPISGFFEVNPLYNADPREATFVIFESHEDVFPSGYRPVDRGCRQMQYVIRDIKKNLKSPVYFVRMSPQHKKETFIKFLNKYLGGYPKDRFSWYSDIPKATREQLIDAGIIVKPNKNSKPVMTDNLYTVRATDKQAGQSDSSWLSCGAYVNIWDENNVKQILDEKKRVVYLNRSTIMKHLDGIPTSSVFSVLRFLTALERSVETPLVDGFGVERVWCVSQRHIKRFKDHPDNHLFVDILTHIKDLYELTVNKHDLCRYSTNDTDASISDLILSLLGIEMRYSIGTTLIDANKVGKLSSSLYDICRYDRYVSEFGRHWPLDAQMEKIGISVSKLPSVAEAQEKRFKDDVASVKDLGSKYPLIKFIDIDEKNLTNVEEYISIIDANTSTNTTLIGGSPNND